MPLLQIYHQISYHIAISRPNFALDLRVHHAIEPSLQRMQFREALGIHARSLISIITAFLGVDFWSWLRQHTDNIFAVSAKTRNYLASNHKLCNRQFAIRLSGYSCSSLSIRLFVSMSVHLIHLILVHQSVSQAIHNSLLASLFQFS